MLEQKVLDFFQHTVPVRSDDSLLLAVSGGPDSMALANLLMEVRDSLGVRLEVAHLDHNLRGTEGRRDARFVSDFCAREGLTLHNRRVDVPELQRTEGGSTEALARRERYAFLNEARAIAGARWIVTGHTANDQAETFLMNLIRGAGPRGLGGMLPSGPGPVCRPMLDCWRDEVLEYLEANSIAYCLDSSNTDLSLTRNRVRHHLVPILEQEFGASVVRTLARESRLMNDLDEFLSLEADRVLRDLVHESDGLASELRLSIAGLRSHPMVMQRSVIRAAIEDLVGGLESFTLSHIDSLVKLVGRTEGRGQVDLPQGLRARREYDQLVLFWEESRDNLAVLEASAPLDLEQPGELRWGRVHLKWSLAAPGTMNPEDLMGDPKRSLFDLDIPVRPIYLRAVQPGDRLEPLGMEGSQKLSDLFINRKVPRHLRTRIPLLCDNGGPEDGERILWVVGQRRSRHAPVIPESSQVVLIEAETIV